MGFRNKLVCLHSCTFSSLIIRGILQISPFSRILKLWKNSNYTSDLSLGKLKLYLG